MRDREAFEKLIPLWAERYGDRWVTFQEIDELAQEIGKPLLYRHARRVDGGRVVASLYRLLEAREGRRRVNLGDRRYSLWRRRGNECWNDVWMLSPEPTDAEIDAQLEAERYDRVIQLVRLWAHAYDDRPITTDELVKIAQKADMTLGYRDSQRARQVAIARLVRTLRGVVVDGWRIAAPSHCRPTKWRLEKLQETVAPVETPPIF
jgi:hypothetical protein